MVEGHILAGTYEDFAKDRNSCMLGADTMKRYGLKVGGPADLIVVDAGSIPEAVATRPRRKLVMKAGRIVARDGALV